MGAACCAPTSHNLTAPLSQVLSDGDANELYGHARLAALGQMWYVGDALVPACAGMCAHNPT